MNKKFIRLMSVLLSVMVLFSCAVSASAEEGAEPAPAEKIDVTVRVEGIDKNLADKEIIVDKLSTVKAVIDAANIDVLYAEDGVTIKSVKGEGEKITSKWQYAVDGVIKTAAVDTCVLEDDAEIILFNATENAVIPSINAEDIELSGVITFTGLDKNGVSAPIAGATITWEVGFGTKTYTTDKDGKIYLTPDELKKGDHTVEISKVNEYKVPEVVRFNAGEEVEVEEYKGENKPSKTLFEEVYDFLYSILKGVVEVWTFYINTFLGLFGFGGNNAA